MKWDSRPQKEGTPERPNDAQHSEICGSTPEKTVQRELHCTIHNFLLILGNRWRLTQPQSSLLQSKQNLMIIMKKKKKQEVLNKNYRKNFRTKKSAPERNTSHYSLPYQPWFDVGYQRPGLMWVSPFNPEKRSVNQDLRKTTHFQTLMTSVCAPVRSLPKYKVGSGILVTLLRDFVKRWAGILVTLSSFILE